jgi:hypothetical protein
LPLNLGAPGAPGVGIGTPSVALRLLSEEEETDVFIGDKSGTSLGESIVKGDKEKF